MRSLEQLKSRPDPWPLNRLPRAARPARPPSPTSPRRRNPGSDSQGIEAVPLRLELRPEIGEDLLPRPELLTIPLELQLFAAVTPKPQRKDGDLAAPRMRPLPQPPPSPTAARSQSASKLSRTRTVLPGRRGGVRSDCGSACCAAMATSMVLLREVFTIAMGWELLEGTVPRQILFAGGSSRRRRLERLVARAAAAESSSSSALGRGRRRGSLRGAPGVAC
mmetsp:Transcript_1696/g.2591  ORF Transcript_1696/g.2591 Transcript_1696/m.2591 type:complete len:221 (-) Transcript_1696:556-1218(-)